MRKNLFIFIGILVVAGVAFALFSNKSTKIVPSGTADASASDSGSGSQAAAGNTAAAVTGALPVAKTIPTDYYVSQTFNNCGEAALSMELSYYNVNVSQQALADLLRPDNNLTGKDDDKSTPPDELAAGAEQYGLIAYFRPNGSINLLKQLIAANFPVLVRTQLNTTEDYAHYRIVKGYDDTTGELIQDDAFQGANLHYSYSDFMALWKPFNYEYIVLATPAQQATLEAILGKDVNATTAWQEAAQTAQEAFAQNPNDTDAGYDLAVADYYIGQYADSVQAFEKVEPDLSEHKIWYQIEPIESYYELGNYSKVFQLSNAILNDNNPAFPELYVLEGESYQKQGQTSLAKQAFETALQYNKNLKSAQDALASLTG